MTTTLSLGKNENCMTTLSVFCIDLDQLNRNRVNDRHDRLTPLGPEQQKGSTDHDAGDARPDRDIDGLFVLHRKRDRTNLGFMCFPGETEAAVDEPQRTRDNQDHTDDPGDTHFAHTPTPNGQNIATDYRSVRLSGGMLTGPAAHRLRL